MKLRLFFIRNSILVTRKHVPVTTTSVAGPVSTVVDLSIVTNTCSSVAGPVSTVIDLPVVISHTSTSLTSQYACMQHSVASMSMPFPWLQGATINGNVNIYYSTDTSK